MKKKVDGGEVIPIPRETAPLWCKLARITACLLLAVRLGLLIAMAFGVRLLIGSAGDRVILFWLDALLLLCGVASLRLPHPKLYWIPAFLAAVGLLIYGANTHAYAQDRSYTDYPSPKGTSTLIVEEDVSMFSGRLRFYRRLNPLFIQQLETEIQLDDGYQSFHRNPRSAVWLDEETVRFGSEAGGTEQDVLLHVGP